MARGRTNGQTVEAVEELREVKKAPVKESSFAISKIETPAPKIDKLLKLRYFVVSFSMSWLDESGQFKRVDDSVKIDGMYGFPNLNELRTQIPIAYNIEGEKNLSVFNVFPLELPEDDFKEFIK